MKKFSLFFLKSFLGPFLFTFFIAIFLLLMQFLWKYIDDLVGKGLDSIVIAELLFYAAARFVPLALPISILMSSIMTYGNIAEKNELIAIKSAGISLQKCMMPIFILVVFISFFSFLFSNYVMPIANLKAGTLLYDIRKQKPALNIQEGVFYNGIKGFSIKIDKKDENGIDLEKIMIYDHSSKKGNDKVVIAEKGKMYLSENEQYFIISLENGYSYYEMEEDSKQKSHPLQRSQFKNDILRFDLSDFGTKKSSKNLYRNHYAMMNNTQLDMSIDSIKAKSLAEDQEFFNLANAKSDLDSNLVKKWVSKKYKSRKVNIYNSAIQSCRQLISNIENNISKNKYNQTIIIKHEVEWHRKLSLAAACIALFLIGAPLGAIIRKGGFGMPVLISVGFFILYHTVSVTGEKMAKEGELSSFEGMWVAIFVLLPIGLFLTYKATKDSTLMALPKFRFKKKS